MFLGIVGSRSRNSHEDYKIIENIVLDYYRTFKRDLILVSGGCSKGADNFAEMVAIKYGIPILIFYPDKIKLRTLLNIGISKKDYAIVAYERNIEIAKKSDILLALVSEDRKGGTEHTIKNFKKYRNGQELLIR